MNKQVGFAARWSRKMLRNFVERFGSKVISEHDEAQARDVARLRRYGAPGASPDALAGILLASDLVAASDDVDPVSARHIRQRILLHAGLVAEAIENLLENRRFERLVAAPVGEESAAAVREVHGTYSCNAKGEVWPGMTFGVKPLRARQHMKGKYPELDAAVQAVLEVRRGGGRFRIGSDGVFLLDGDRRVA